MFVTVADTGGKSKSWKSDFFLKGGWLMPPLFYLAQTYPVMPCLCVGSAAGGLGCYPAAWQSVGVIVGVISESNSGT